MSKVDMQDVMYEKAIELVQKEGKASTSFVQRHLQIGYNHAARIIERMEENGIVTPASPTGLRAVVGFVETSEKKESETIIEQEEERVTEEQAAKPELPGIGHNSEPDNCDGEPKDVGGIAGSRLRAFIERIERMEEEKAALMEDIKEVYAEAKGVGYDVKTIRKIISLRKMDSEKRREAEEILELYKSAIGMA